MKQNTEKEMKQNIRTKRRKSNRFIELSCPRDSSSTLILSIFILYSFSYSNPKLKQVKRYPETYVNRESSFGKLNECGTQWN